MLEKIEGIHPLIKLFGAVIVVAIALLVLPSAVQPIIFWLIVFAGLTMVWYQILSNGIKVTQWLSATIRDYPMRFSYACFGLAIPLIFLASFYYMPTIANLHAGFYLLMLGLLLLFPARHVLPAWQAHAEDDTFPAEHGIRYPAILIAIGCLLVLTMINTPGRYMQQIQLDLGLSTTPIWIQMILFCGGIIGLVHGFGGRLLPKRFQWEQHHTILLLIVLLATVIRVWDIENTIRMFVDEYSFIDDINLIRYANPELLLPRYSPSTQVYPFFQALFSMTLGAGFTSIRLPSIVLGVASVLAIYTLARQLFSVRVALITALLVATLPVHLQFSRIGLNNVGDAVFGVFGFAYILRGMRSRRMADYAMAGIMFGLTHYFYEGGRLFFTPFALCWLIWIHLFTRRDRMFRPTTQKQLLAFVFCLVILVLPMYHTFYQFSFPLVERLNVTGVENSVLTDRVYEFLSNFDPIYFGASIHRYVATEAIDGFFRSPYAYIMPLLVPFFLLGIGRLVWRLQTVRGSLLFWWMIGAYVGNSLIESANSSESPRYIVVYSILMLVVVMGIQTVWVFVVRRVDVKTRHYLNIAVISGILLVSVWQVGHFFSETVPNFYTYIHNRRALGDTSKPSIDDMLLRALELPDNTTVVFLSNVEFPGTHSVVLPTYFGRDDGSLKFESAFIWDLDYQYFRSLPRDTNYVFTFIPVHRDQVMPLIEQYFVITEITGSNYDIPEDVEMLFAHAPLSVNGEW